MQWRPSEQKRSDDEKPKMTLAAAKQPRLSEDPRAEVGWTDTDGGGVIILRWPDPSLGTRLPDAG